MDEEEETQQILKVLKSLKQASQQLQTNPEEANNSSESDSSSSSSSAIKALLNLDIESDPNLSNLSHHLSDLKILISSLQKSKNKHGRIKSFLTKHVKNHEITRVAESIESEIQTWIDRESIMNLTLQLQQIRSRTNLLETSSSSSSSNLLSLQQIRSRTDLLELSSSSYEEERNHTLHLQQILSRTNLLESSSSSSSSNSSSSLQQIRSRTDLLELSSSSYEEERNHTLHLQQIRSTNFLESISSGSSSSQSEEEEENEVIEKLTLFQYRLGQGFNINLQGLLLKSNIFSELEFLLCTPNVPQRVREKAGYALKEVVLFNKDVFVGQVLIGQTIKSLVSMDSLCSLEVLTSLIKAIRSPLVDVIESVGGISKVISYLNSEDLAMKLMSMNCILEIAYFGRKEAIEAMLNCGLIKKLVQLQRSKLGGDLIDLGKVHQDQDEDEDEDEDKDEEKKKRGYGEKRYLEKHPFASCVARFGVQLEVGEGLRQREKRGFKQEILKKIREACDTDAEAATIVAEVLWGSSP